MALGTNQDAEANASLEKGKAVSDETIKEAAMHYHRFPKPGKLEIVATKPLGNQRDLALAYSPGVARPSLPIPPKRRA